MRKVRPLVLALSLVLVGCTEPPGAEYRTWAVTNEPLPPAHRVTRESELPPGAEPWAGTVSHHLLTNDLIDAWFAGLADRRSVEVFWILSPSHWGLSHQPVSVADGRWAVTGGWVETDRVAARRLAGRLGVPLEPGAFYPEHGVSTLVPYVARHFPGARVVALAYRGEPPVDQPAADRLLASLAPEFTGEDRQKNFMLLSADFAHHGNLEGTEKKDRRSRKWFDRPRPEDWIFVGCDNRPGIYALAHLMETKDRINVLFHTNSWFLSGESPDDITSYFFTYVWSTPPGKPGSEP